MTRQELLDRLLALKAGGDDMDLPIVLRIGRKIPDKRRRHNIRYEEVTALLTSAYSGSLGYGETWGAWTSNGKNEPGRVPCFAELRGDLVLDWRPV